MQRIDLETEKAIAVSVADDKESQGETVFGGENDYGNRDVSIINQGQIKIKYASNTTSNVDVMSPHNPGSVGQDSVNDRQ